MVAMEYVVAHELAYSLAVPASPPHVGAMPDPTERLNAALEGRYAIERELAPCLQPTGATRGPGLGGPVAAPFREL